MKSSIPMGAALIALTTLFLTGCSSTSTPTSSSSSPMPNSTASSGGQSPTSSGGQSPTSSGGQSPTSSGVQTSTTAANQTTSSTAPSTGANKSVATCQTQHLTLTQGRVGAATGITYVTYYLQNHGPSTCSMVGYPGVSLLFANGSVIQRPAARDRTAYSPVRLQPGQRAQFVLRTVDASIPGTGCSSSWKTAAVQVYPPNQTTSIRQSSTIGACDLTVGPVLAA
jgi:Protein of unknown function (DUF4232)